MAWVDGFEPSHLGVKVLCLTAWLHPNIYESQTFKPLNLVWISEYVVAYSKFLSVEVNHNLPTGFNFLYSQTQSKESTVTTTHYPDTIQIPIGCFPNMYSGDNGSRTHVHNAYSLQIFLRRSHCLIQFL